MKKIYVKILLVLLLLGVSFVSYSQIINTIAGNGFAGYDGDGGPATAAELFYPNSVECDTLGNVYFADLGNNRIRMVNPSGNISTFAGNGYSGRDGDGGPATAAELYEPSGIALDVSGNIYFADAGNNRIRKVNTLGIISTIAGNGYSGFYGDGGEATNAEFYDPQSLALDSKSNIYISDWGNSRVRIINSSGIISTFAGGGPSGLGDGGPATDAKLYLPNGIAVDLLGNIYISDNGNNRIRKVNISDTIFTIAGIGVLGYSGDGGMAINAEIDYPTSIASDESGNIYFADAGNSRIRKVSISGIINTFAGNGQSGFYGDGGPASNAEFNGPTGLSLDAFNNLYIVDNGNERVRKVNNVTGINELSSILNEINIYPVPTTRSFTISGIPQDQIIEIYNYTGQLVLSTISHQPSANFDISNQPNGIYFVRILNKDGSIYATKKIVKTQ